MQISKRLPLLLSSLVLGLALILPISQNANADEGVEELSYSDLVDQLREKRRRVASPIINPLDDIALHASVAMATSLSSFEVDGRNMTRGMNGFQIALGIDLFDPSWMAELALRNFGTRESGTESQSLREVDLKVLHRVSIGQKLGYRVGAGLSTRYLKFSDPAYDVSLSEESPNLIFATGLDSYVTDHVSLGAEIGFRTALVDQSMDKNSVDLMLRLETSF